jgi:CRP-like cAMP-binding protein
VSGQPSPCDRAELGRLFLFEKLDDGQLDRLCREGRVERFEPGPVYREGDPATCFFVLLEGTVVLSRRVGDDDVEVSRSSQVGVYAGAFQAYLGDQADQARYKGSMRVTVPSRFYVLPADAFARIMRDWFPMAVHLLEGVFFGHQNTQRTINQRERLLALGSLSAGLTHELNNPAAAAVRATSALRERVAGMRHKLGVIASGPYKRATLEALVDLQERTAEQVATGRTSCRTGSTTTASRAAGSSRRPSSRPGSTPPGWTRSRPPWTSTPSKARSAGSTTPSRPSC